MNKNSLIAIVLINMFLVALSALYVASIQSPAVSSNITAYNQRGIDISFITVLVMLVAGAVVFKLSKTKK